MFTVPTRSETDYAAATPGDDGEIFSKKLTKAGPARDLAPGRRELMAAAMATGNEGHFEVRPKRFDVGLTGGRKRRVFGQTEKFGRPLITIGRASF